MYILSKIYLYLIFTYLLLTKVKLSILRSLAILELYFLFGNYIRFGVTIGLGNRAKSYFGIIIIIEFVVIFLYLKTLSPKFVVERNYELKQNILFPPEFFLLFIICRLFVLTFIHKANLCETKLVRTHPRVYNVDFREN